MPFSPGLTSFDIHRTLLIALSLVAIVTVACGADPVTGDGSPGALLTPTVSDTPTATPSSSSEAPNPAAPAEPTEAISRGDAPGTISPPSVEELTERALVHLRELSVGLPPRVSGTDGELAAAGYIADQLRSYGYEVQFQEFTARSRPRNGNHLQVTSPNPYPVRTNIFTGSGEGDVNGPLVFVDLGRESDLPNFSMDGMVALVERGQISFAQKARNVFEAGAEGMVVFNSVSEIFDGTLGEGFELTFDRPSVTIAGTDGEALLAEIENGPVNVSLRLVTEERPSRNVVATRTGDYHDAPVVIIGGHYDAVPDSPGANDNASGTATFLVLAEELVNTDLPFELRVIGFGSEELGLLGSAAYVASLDEAGRSRITAMFNYDALGSGSLEIGGHLELSGRGLDVADEIGISAVRGIEPPGATSDHASFRDAGIPSIFFFGSDLSLIHTPLDTINAMDPEMMGRAAAITLNGLLDGLGAE
ncbi:MAG: M28 family peptidase [Dehalococcoidia bacterium]|jgi:aminopeptidase YwaD|nr:M28 family peptidase [Dehalococcoidia bacterium]